MLIFIRRMGTLLLTINKGDGKMDINRALQIIGSEDTIEVLHQGLPVWIEDINRENNTAAVKNINGKEMIKKVPVEELVEN